AWKRVLTRLGDKRLGRCDAIPLATQDRLGAATTHDDEIRALRIPIIHAEHGVLAGGFLADLPSVRNAEGGPCRVGRRLAWRLRIWRRAGSEYRLFLALPLTQYTGHGRC